jgi:hypothetical protein
MSQIASSLPVKFLGIILPNQKIVPNQLKTHIGTQKKNTSPTSSLMLSLKYMIKKWFFFSFMSYNQYSKMHPSVEILSKSV